jgi:NADP-dependent 3-hydroxy acid dehydrogenase YdfG
MHPAIRKDGVAVVTGAAVGLGYANAHRLAQEGMKLVLLDCDAPALEKAASELQAASPQLVQCSVVGDVTDNAAVEVLYRKAVGLGAVALLVNNAAIATGAGPWEASEQWLRVMEINFWACLALQQRFVPTLLEQSSASAIVSLGSKEGITTPPGNAAYSVSKARRAHTDRATRARAARTGAGPSDRPFADPGVDLYPDELPRHHYRLAQAARDLERRAGSRSHARRHERGQLLHLLSGQRGHLGDGSAAHAVVSRRHDSEPPGSVTLAPGLAWEVR